MFLLIKGFIVGIGKIIPGVSGAILAINFNIYERLLDAITNFFKDWKSNLKFIIVFGSGVILSIVLCSNIILYLLNNHKFLTMMFFIGLILGGTYNFSKQVTLNYKNIIIILLVALICLIISLITPSSSYILKNNFYDNFILFIGGIIEIFSSLIPGISGTSLLMLLGIYNEILNLISKIYNFGFVSHHLALYISYGFGMFISFIINSYLISYLLNKHRQITNIIILALSIGSIIFMLLVTMKEPFTCIEFILGIMLLTIGLVIASIFDK